MAPMQRRILGAVFMIDVYAYSLLPVQQRH